MFTDAQMTSKVKWISGEIDMAMKIYLIIAYFVRMSS